MSHHRYCNRVGNRTEVGRGREKERAEMRDAVGRKKERREGNKQEK